MVQLAVARRLVAVTRVPSLALTRILWYFALTRLTLFIVAAIATRFPTRAPPPPEVYLPKNLAGWVRWDAGWYLSVVERGYWFDPQGQSNVAFFPLFPLLIKGVAFLVGPPVVAGLIVANVAALGAVVAFWAWVRAEAGPEAAESAVRWLLVFPFSFFFHSIYGESVFFLLVALAFLAAGRQRWPAAGLCGGFAAATRPIGILLFPAFAWGLWRAWRDGRKPGVVEALSVLLVPAGLGAYVVYLWAEFGSPLAFWHAHAVGWGVLQLHENLAWYWRDVHSIFTRGPRIHTPAHLLDTLRIVLPLVFIGLTIQVFRRLGPVPGLYTGLAVLVSILFAPESVGRELLTAIPAFAAAGMMDRSSTGEGVRMLSMGLLLIFLFAFVRGRFVG